MNLTQAALYTKRFVIFSIVFLILIIIGVISYRVWHTWYLAKQPKPVIKPEQKYGELPPIKFPPSKSQASSFSYSIDTTTGNLPKFDPFVKVYFIPRPVVTLLASDRSNQLAAKLGITTRPTPNADSTNFNYNQNQTSLSVNLDSSNFKYINPASPSANLAFTDSESTLVGGFKSILTTLNLLKEDLAQGPYKIQYFQYGNPLTPVASLKDANVARVSLWPGKIGDQTILTSDPNISLVNGLFFTAANDLKNYMEINYTYWPIDLTDSSNYYLKSADEALANLKANDGTIIQPPVSSNVSITNVTLAYFLPDEYTSYLQPIYVFSGPSFIAYVSAVGTEPIASPSTTNSQ